MRPQSGHRAQHAYYVMRKERHSVDLVIYGLFWRHLGAILRFSWCPRTPRGDIDL